MDQDRNTVHIRTMPPKDPELASDLVPIGKFRSGTAKILKDMAEEGRTLVITQNGEAAAVVMSPREFESSACGH